MFFATHSSPLRISKENGKRSLGRTEISFGLMLGEREAAGSSGTCEEKPEKLAERYPLWERFFSFHHLEKRHEEASHSREDYRDLSGTSRE